MLHRFLATQRRTRLRTASVPADTRVYVIGDIHGCIDLLRRLHGRIIADARDAGASHKQVVYLGDYIDRGLESREVIDLLLDEPLPGFESIYLRGNHEQAMLDFLRDVSIGPDWFAYGGDATLYSYKVGLPAQATDSYTLEKVRADLSAKLPERHLAFLRASVLLHRAGDYLFVHAGIKPDVPIEEQSDYDLMWIREEFLESNADHGCIVVHGHTIAPRPVIKPNRIGIDTGAYATGRLTCLKLEEDEREFLAT